MMNNEEIILEILKDKNQPISLNELVGLASRKFIFSKQTVKEVVWKLNEEGKISFTDDWFIQIEDDNDN